MRILKPHSKFTPWSFLSNARFEIPWKTKNKNIPKYRTRAKIPPEEQTNTLEEHTNIPEKQTAEDGDIRQHIHEDGQIQKY